MTSATLGINKDMEEAYTIFGYKRRPKFHQRIFTNINEYQKVPNIHEYLRILKPKVTNTRSMGCMGGTLGVVVRVGLLRPRGQDSPDISNSILDIRN